MELVLKSTLSVSAGTDNMAPVGVSSLVVRNSGSQVVDAHVNTVDSNSVSFERNSESSNSSLMLMNFLLDGSARSFFLMSELNFVFVLGSQPLDHMGFSSNQSLVVSDLVDMNLDFSVMNGDFMTHMVDLALEPMDGSLMRAHLLVVVFTFELSPGRSHSDA